MTNINIFLSHIYTPCYSRVELVDVVVVDMLLLICCSVYVAPHIELFALMPGY